MQKKQLSVLVLIILCFLLGCNRETPKDESQQNYEDESNICLLYTSDAADD